MSSAASAAASGASPKRLFCGVGAAGVTGSAGFGFAGTPTCSEYARIGLSMFLSWVGPRSVTAISSRPLTWR